MNTEKKYDNSRGLLFLCGFRGDNHAIRRLSADAFCDRRFRHARDIRVAAFRGNSSRVIRNRSYMSSRTPRGALPVNASRAPYRHRVVRTRFRNTRTKRKRENRTAFFVRLVSQRFSSGKRSNSGRPRMSKSRCPSPPVRIRTDVRRKAAVVDRPKRTKDDSPSE